MSIDLWDIWGIERTSKAIRFLEIWSRTGDLYAVTFNVIRKEQGYRSIKKVEYLLGVKENEDERDRIPKRGGGVIKNTRQFEVW